MWHGDLWIISKNLPRNQGPRIAHDHDHQRKCHRKHLGGRAGRAAVRIRHGKISGDLQAVAVGATNLVATLIAMTMIDRFGRKKLLLTGTVGLTICLSAISYVFIAHRHLHWLVWLLMAYIACFAASQGAVVWVYISEVFPNRVRAKGQGLGSSSHWVSNAIISLVFPIMAGTSGAYPFIFFAAMMALDFFLVLFYYPETSGISLEKMEHTLGID